MEPLEYYPSMNPASILLHYKWRIRAVGTLLLSEEGWQVLDLDGQPIRCLGAWVSPENLEQCCSGIARLRAWRVDIMPLAPNALSWMVNRSAMDADFTGLLLCFLLCYFFSPISFPLHLWGLPKLWSSGNPNKDALVDNFTKSYMNMMSHYHPNGDSPIMPMELKLIRDHLMSSNHLWDFMLYTILLISCRLF